MLFQPLTSALLEEAQLVASFGDKRTKITVTQALCASK
jgi:hypothetical protein